ncbi:MAG: ribonuclease III [Pseudomonadota bacterium]
MNRPARPKRTRLRAAAKAKKRPTLSPDARKALETAIGYRFKDESLLTRALTHPSLIDDFDGGPRFSNQRLEFLGDRVLGLVIAQMLLRKYPGEREGQLTKLFHRLVSGETCAKVGAGLDLRQYLFMDASMQHNKAGHYDKAVGDAVEAMIAAIFEDGGLNAAESFIRRVWLFEPDGSDAAPSNPKTALSDWCGANRAAYASYHVVSQEGPAHAPVFTVRAEVDNHGAATGTGGSKQEAEMTAATNLLKDLSSND